MQKQPLAVVNFFTPSRPQASRPERTLISRRAAPDNVARARFYKENAHEVHQRHEVPQEIPGSVVEGPAVHPPQHRIRMEALPFPLSSRP